VGVTAGASERHDMKILHLDSSALGANSASRPESRVASIDAALREIAAIAATAAQADAISQAA
jgi:hypothetical protein